MERLKAARASKWLCLATALAATPVGVRAQATQPANGGGAAGDAAGDVASEADWRRQVEARMAKLEQENADLRQRLGVVADTQQAVMKDAQSRGLLTLEGGQPRLTTPDFFDVNKYA